MRYITDQHPEHRNTWCVCEDDQVLEVLPDADRTQAVTVLASGYDWQAGLTAAGGEVMQWEADPAIAYEGVPTSDRRQLQPGSVRTRQLPQPLMWNVTTSQGHQGAVIAGAVDEFARRGDQLWAAGRFDTGAMGAEASRLVADDVMRGVSIDLAASTVETEVLAVDDGGYPTDWLDCYTDAELAGLTGTPMPAFANARIKIRDTMPSAIPAPTAMPVAAGGVDRSRRNHLASFTLALRWADLPAIIASGSIDLASFGLDLAHFAEPENLSFDSSPINVEADRRVWGWLAPHGVCHQGIEGTCVTAEQQSSDLSDFLRKTVQIGGTDVRVGLLTMDTGHAHRTLNPEATERHYDDTTTVCAVVTAGIRHGREAGVWFSGTHNPSLSEWQIAVLSCADVSGDWRYKPELNARTVRAAHVVPVPGFMVPHAPLAASGITVGSMTFTNGMNTSGESWPTTTLASMVASASCSCGGHAATLEQFDSGLAERIERLESSMRALVPVAANELDGRMAEYWESRSVDQRKADVKAGIARPPSGDYPIADVAGLHKAIQAYGRASDKPAVKAWIVKRAKALKATDQLPKGWA